jgi:hypothetical protein
MILKLIIQDNKSDNLPDHKEKLAIWKKLIQIDSRLEREGIFVAQPRVIYYYTYR